MRWAFVGDLAGVQHGVVARRQLLARGVADSSIRHEAVRSGWRQLHRGVYLLPGLPVTFETRTAAAVLASGEPALASHLTAAWLHGLLREPPPVVDVLLPYRLRARSLEGVHFTRSRTLASRDRCVRRGIPTTTVPRTLIDIAGVLEPPGLRAMVIDAVQRRLVRPERVVQRLLDIGPVRGSGELRRILWELDRERCDSILEHRVRRLLRRAELPVPSPAPHPVDVGGRVLRIDIAWPERQVGIEVDGTAYHSDRAALDRDHRRHNVLMLAGWRLLRVGWDRVERDAERFTAEVRRLLGPM